MKNGNQKTSSSEAATKTNAQVVGSGQASLTPSLETKGDVSLNLTKQGGQFHDMHIDYAVGESSKIKESSGRVGESLVWHGHDTS
jgi:hypothetical protein